jgi:molecular chaperone GrpE
MTDEAHETESSETQPSGLDDPRFEVKWRKKPESTSSAGTATADLGTPGASPAADNAEVEALRGELEKERERVKDLQDRWQRAAADLANFRRRTEQERGEAEQFASMRLVQELLPVLDNFERAIATIPSNLAMLTWIQGVMLIQRHLEALLEQRGLAPIEAQGQAFNPHYHEAVSEREQEGVVPGTIVQEYQRGYSMHGRVIRPTLVEIAKAPAAQAPSEESPQPSEPLPTDTSDTEEIAEESESENTGP